MSAEKVIQTARGELGYTEAPAGSNNTKYGRAYAWDGIPWCAVFLWWCFRQAGESAAFYGGGKTASCGTLLHWYQARGQTVPAEEVQAGDIVILNFSGTADTQHCGLVAGVAARMPQGAPSVIRTIEGNTTPGAEGSQDNGGCVALKTRYPSQIVAVCRPQYKKEEPMDKPKDDIAGHWAETSIRKAISKGVMQGYPDGTWLPDRDVTRAELAVILDRLGLLE